MCELYVAIHDLVAKFWKISAPSHRGLFSFVKIVISKDFQDPSCTNVDSCYHRSAVDGCVAGLNRRERDEPGCSP